MNRTPSVCEQRPGMCCGDARCPDQLCPGHPFMDGIPAHGDNPPETPDTAGAMVVIAAKAALFFLVFVLGALAEYFA